MIVANKWDSIKDENNPGSRSTRTEGPVQGLGSWRTSNAFFISVYLVKGQNVKQAVPIVIIVWKSNFTSVS